MSDFCPCVECVTGLPIADQPIREFRGPFDFLSNFYHSPFSFNDHDGRPAPTAEHAFQSLKALRLDDAAWVLSAPTPGEAKKRGRQVVLRPDWEWIKTGTMAYVLERKFRGGSTLERLLVGTYPRALIEGNTWGDRFWGVDTRVGEGENHLGRLLVQLRERKHREFVAVHDL